MTKRILMFTLAAGALAAPAAEYTVGTVEELTNAVHLINMEGGSGGTIYLKPGRYDLSTLEPATFSKGSTAVWGTMSTPDAAGTACIWFRYNTTFVGLDDTP